jgi:L-aspartate oxidase
LLAQRGPDGTVRLTTALGQEFRLECCAHAGNGGAVVDRHGQTSVAGLFACGECATGMHGANRLGGGMVLASQVFGARAGAGAARWAAENCPEIGRTTARGAVRSPPRTSAWTPVCSRT